MIVCGDNFVAKMLKLLFFYLFTYVSVGCTHESGLYRYEGEATVVVSDSEKNSNVDAEYFEMFVRLLIKDSMPDSHWYDVGDLGERIDFYGNDDSWVSGWVKKNIDDLMLCFEGEYLSSVYVRKFYSVRSVSEGFCVVFRNDGEGHRFSIPSQFINSRDCLKDRMLVRQVGGWWDVFDLSGLPERSIIDILKSNDMNGNRLLLRIMQLRNVDKKL